MEWSFLDGILKLKKNIRFFKKNHQGNLNKVWALDNATSILAH